ncbi:hypothetical protein BGZ60DRAFT_527804 [Tricladium varicosporioides]|nr:hypothetical protein BGZ60DRAFT_527804 [Hymenoscyphus varicosporioides]
MMFTIFTSLTFLAAYASVLSTAIPEGLSFRDTSLGLAEAEMTYTGTIHGIEFTSSGTVEQIYNAFTQAHPDAAATTPFNTTDSGIEERSPANKGDIFCCNGPSPAPQGWYPAETATIIREGVPYLKNFPGLCGVPARTCNFYGITPSCYYLATYAEDLTGVCGYFYYGRFFTPGTCGQEFDTDHYNIIVREEPC